jgi:hypothetical protein
MEKEPAVLMYKPGSAELPWFFKIVLHTFDMESCLYSSVQGIDREHAVLKKRIVPVPYEVILITVEYRPDPFLLIGQYGTVTGNDRTEYRFCHLRLKTNLISQFQIQSIVHSAVSQRMRIKDPFRHKVTGTGISFGSIEQ